jgi:hypothetical protein
MPAARLQGNTGGEDQLRNFARVDQAAESWLSLKSTKPPTNLAPGNPTTPSPNVALVK